MGVFRDLIDAGCVHAMTARSDLISAKSHLKNASTHIANQEWVLARVDFDHCADSLGSAAFAAFYTNFASNTFVTQWRDALYWLDDNWPSNGVTMDAILTAMATASFDELRTFMGVTDAYKAAVWNAPFNAEYYAALARGFINKGGW